jgi:hypothetical protein
MAAYAVAQMRITQTLRKQFTDTQLGDLRLHLADTLADPYERATLFTFLPDGDPLVENTARRTGSSASRRSLSRSGRPHSRRSRTGDRSAGTNYPSVSSTTPTV